MNINNTNHRYTQKMQKADTLVTSGKYNEAITVYGEALKLKSNSEVNAKIDKTLILKKSADAFNSGMKDFNAKNYETAIASFKSVIKEDSKNYVTAVDKIKQCIKLVDDSAIKQAQESASKKDYEMAIQCVNTALGTDVNNRKLLNLKAKYTIDKADAEARVKAKAEADAIAKAKADAKAEADAKAKAQELVEEQEANAKDKARTEGVRIGMTKQECLDSTWGQPDSINKTTTAYGTSEQWVYNIDDYNMNFLYFDGNILTDIQN